MVEPRGTPRFSIIITCWNYAGFLPAAIDSALSQSLPAHQIIVVDDGSSDGSRRILERYGARIAPVLRANGGQAAAFETGFSQATGDIIIFLDADDVLKPEALATIAMVWDAGYAAVCFGMELIDRHGRPRGLYPHQTADIDHRPLLGETASFSFMPTSANAFARRVIELAAPFPKTRWRISADAYLLRVAALAGRILPLEQTLVSYRIHEGNNYYRLGASQIWLNRRDMTDIVDLAAFFGQWPRLHLTESGIASRMAMSLARSGLRRSVGLTQLGYGDEVIGRMLLHLAATMLRGSGPILPRLTTAGLALLLAPGLWRLPGVARWIKHPEHRPALVRWLLDGMGRRSMLRHMEGVRTPRWRAPTALNETISAQMHATGSQLLGSGWTITRFEGQPKSHDRRAVVSLSVAPTPRPLLVRLVLISHGGWAKRPIAVRAYLKTEFVTEAEITGDGEILVPVPGGTAAQGGAVDIELRLRPGGRLSVWRGLGDLLRPPPTVMLESVRVEPGGDELDPAGVLDGTRRSVLGLVGDVPGWIAGEEGEARLAAATAILPLMSLRTPHPVLARLELSGAQPAGWMRIVAGGEDLFAGRWAESDVLWLRVPVEADEPVIVELAFAFVPEDATETRRPGLRAVSFTWDRDDPMAGGVVRSSHAPVAPINPGQVLTFRPDDIGRHSMGAGWDLDQQGLASLVGAEGRVDLLITPELTGLSAQLEVEVDFAAPEGMVHLLVVSHRGDALQRVVLAGPGSVAVPLDALVAAGPGLQSLALHSVYVPEDGDGDGSAVRRAPLRLQSIALDGTAVGQARAVPGISRLAGSAEAQLDAARRLLASTAGQPELADGLRSARSALIAAVVDLDRRALHSFLAEPVVLETLLRMGELLGRMETSDPGWPMVSDIAGRTAPPAQDGDALREIVIAMLSLPASEVPHLAKLEGLPAAVFWNSEPFARYLGRDPDLLTSRAARTGYEAFIATLLERIDILLAREPVGAPLHRLALETLRHLRPQRVFFGEGPRADYARAFGRAIERHMTHAGFALDRAFGQDRRPGARLRVGIMLISTRPAPETYIVRAMLAGLDRAHIEPVLIVLDGRGPPMPDSTIPGSRFFIGDIARLDGLSVAEAVDHVRGLDLDVFILGSVFLGFDRLAAIVAHRLARVQLATAAISPISTGLRSFDAFLSSRLIEPETADGHYVEPVQLLEGPVQCFAFFGTELEDPHQSPAWIRRRLQLPLDRTLLVSGAMMKKIGPELLAAWAKILSRVPEAVLVLYPYAQNWNTGFARPQFEDWARAILAAEGVGADRVLFMSPLEARDVGRLLKAADLYLDSFPYAGATTVVEALDHGLPVVALRGATQRERQGAGWLEAMGLGDDIADTVEAYVERGVALASDRDMRARRRDAILDRKVMGAPYADIETCGRALTDALLSLAGRAGIAPVPVAEKPRAIAPGQPVRYVFHHMARTAGASCKAIFREWFDRVEDEAPELQTDGPDPSSDQSAGLSPDTLLCRRSMPHDTPAGEGWRVFTFVRDPLELAQSDYFARGVEGGGESGAVHRSLDEHLSTERDIIARHFNCTADTWREVLDRYWFIGTTERLEACLDYLAEHFGEERIETPLLNVAPRAAEPSAGAVERFLRNNALDYEIFAEIRRRLEERLAPKT